MRSPVLVCLSNTVVSMFKRQTHYSATNTFVAAAIAFDSCTLHSRATMYCVNDDAYLCQVCDEEHHANPLGAKHVRQRIDTVYKTQVSGTSFDDVAVVPQLEGQDDLFSSDVLFPEVDVP
eukprot:jgi/Picre1/28560/NNA_003962.t1